jgi:hypothetical protein
MLKVELDAVSGIAILEPVGELSKSDFVSAAKAIDPYIENTGALNGLIIQVRSFPGWDSFSSLIAHLKFVREHHKKVSRVAFVTDSPIGSIAESVASHFVNAEIKTFEFGALAIAKEWILDDGIR